MPSLLSDPTHCCTRRLSGRVEDEACILDPMGRLGRAVCSPTLSSLVPTHVMPPTQHAEGPLLWTPNFTPFKACLPSF